MEDSSVGGFKIAMFHLQKVFVSNSNPSLTSMRFISIIFSLQSWKKSSRTLDVCPAVFRCTWAYRTHLSQGVLLFKHLCQQYTAMLFASSNFNPNLLAGVTRLRSFRHRPVFICLSNPWFSLIKCCYQPCTMICLASDFNKLQVGPLHLLIMCVGV